MAWAVVGGKFPALYAPSGTTLSKGGVCVWEMEGVLYSTCFSAGCGRVRVRWYNSVAVDRGSLAS